MLETKKLIAAVATTIKKTSTSIRVSNEAITQHNLNYEVESKSERKMF